MSRSKRKSKAYSNPQPELQKLHPMTHPQEELIESIHSNPVTIAYGSPGTGKTLLALHEFIWLLHWGKTDKVLYLKPNTPVGKSIGYLPGTVEEKLDPLLYPVKDNLSNFCSDGKSDIMIRKKQIEAFPLEYVRGRSIRDTCVILDEAQNCTSTEVKTVISRIGEGSKLVITGDAKQRDTKYEGKSGLEDAVRRLRGLPIVGLIEFFPEDVVRTGWLKDVLRRYE